MDSLIDIKKKVLEISKVSYQEGLFAGTSGNLSFFDKDKQLVVITPSSVRYNTMQLDDLVVLDLDGNVVEGKNRPSSEWKMHLAMYKNREDVSSVFHTHSPYATAFAVARHKIPVILIEMVPFIGGDIPVADMAMPGSEDMGIQALKVMDERNSCLLSNHGVLTIGKTVDQAHIRAEYTEDAAKIYHYALSVGDVNLVPESMVKEMKDRIANR